MNQRTGPQTEAEEFRLAFDRRRRLIVGELAKIDGVTVPNPLGAFYVYPDVRGLLATMGQWNGQAREQGDGGGGGIQTPDQSRVRRALYR